MAVDAARAKSLFLAASDLDDPAERAAYLERECGGDAELRARVEALLRAKAAPLPLAPGATVDSADGQPETGDQGWLTPFRALLPNARSSEKSTSLMPKIRRGKMHPLLVWACSVVPGHGG
jgi:hypothetical protein